MTSIPTTTAATRSRVARLADAVRAYVQPGMHLHFASTPSRSNASIREVARAFYGRRPGFTLSTTGFHSMAHLLPLLHLGRRLVSCFFGDNYPSPRPNPLYTRLVQSGVALEHWSLWSLISALRAGAQGDRWVINRSLAGTSIAADLQARGAYRELPDPSDSRQSIGLCAAMRPDITFVHAAIADDDGHVLMSAPNAEGWWSALAARRGVIVTVERLAPRAWTREHPDLVVLPPHRVLAVCEEPYGAHPQPFLCVPALGVASYRDDFDHYARWRRITTDESELGPFVDKLMGARDGGEAYRAIVGTGHLESLRVARGRMGHGRTVTPVPGSVPKIVAARGATASATSAPPSAAATASATTASVRSRTTERMRAIAFDQLPPLHAIDRMLVAGSRQIVSRAKAVNARVLLAGIGHAFFAARIAQQRLAGEGVELTVMVETGLYGVDCGPVGNNFLLAYDNLAHARRLSSIDDVLGVLGCGADNHCLAVLGAAQVDHHGNLNSTRLETGAILVGSGGACDIAAAAAETIVLTRPNRLVDKLPYVTSVGKSVRSVVTDRGVLRRESDDGWSIDSLVQTNASSPSDHIAELRRECSWSLEAPVTITFAPPPTREELRLLAELDPEGTFRQRSRP
jgi:acyl CoA:acetate/3-ketoacid CoA transferase alpha subunit